MSQDKRTTAIVSFCRAYPPESGGASVTYNLSKFLPGMRFLFQVTEREDTHDGAPGFELIEMAGLPRNKYLKAFWLMTKYPSMLRKIRERAPDLVILEGSSWSLYSLALLVGLKRRLRKARFVYHAHNVEYVLRRGKDHRVVAWLGRWAEGLLVKRSDLALAVSVNDAAAFDALYGIRPQILPNCVDSDWFLDVPPERVRAVRKKYRLNGTSVLFMGLIGYPANDQAVDFLIRNVFPGLHEAVPSARLVILGGTIREQRPWIENPGVVPFKELPAFLAASDVCVAPIFSGSGTRLKILEYLASGKPVVATTKAAEGLDLEDGSDLLIADSPQAFTASVIRLLTDRDMALRLSRTGQESVRARYSWNRVVPGLVAKLDALAGLRDTDS